MAILVMWFVLYWKWSILGFIIFILWDLFDLSQKIILERMEIASNIESEQLYADLRKIDKLKDLY